MLLLSVDKKIKKFKDKSVHENMTGDNEKKYKFILRFNLFMGILHLIQASLILFLSNDFSLDITSNFLTFNTETNSITNSFKSITSVRLGPIVALFLFLSAFAHFTVLIGGIKNWYLENLKKGINYARWIEYSISSSVMLIPIALLCGLSDLISLIMLVSLNALMNLLGLVMEKINLSKDKDKIDWLPFNLGTFAGIIPWVGLFAYFFAALNSSSEAVPTFVYYIIFILFATFNIFPVNMYLQYRKIGPWKNYLFGEIVYIFLSLTAKSLLAWQVFGGTLR